jgi:hypothetical protein
MRPSAVRAFFLLVSLILSARAALAQFDTASVVGTVRDASGAVVPDANDVLGPNFWQVDFAAGKNATITSALRLQLRLEAFNLFNRVNFTPPAANRSASSFGTVTSTFDARQLQLGLKLLW